MKAIITACGLGLFLAGLPAIALAMPIQATPGSQRCKCTCGVDGWGAKDLDWSVPLGGCNSNGFSCKLWDKGARKYRYGTLHSCDLCTYQTSTSYTCGIKAVTPSGTVQPATPSQQAPGATPREKTP